MTSKRFEGSGTGLLPMPNARNVKGHNQRRNQDCLEGAIAYGMSIPANTAGWLLPTPCANETISENRKSTMWKPGNRRNIYLSQACRWRMTGIRSDGTPDPDWQPARPVDWGRFEPAIRRWGQTLGRPAPCPTQVARSLIDWCRTAPRELFDGRWVVRHLPLWDGHTHIDQPMRDRMLRRWQAVSDGSELLDTRLWNLVAAGQWNPDKPIPSTLLPRENITDWWQYWQKTRRPALAHLSPRFTEWMMGLPDGWLTDPDIWENVQGNHRNLQLRLYGNGVVPQQGALAIGRALGMRRMLAGHA